MFHSRLIIVALCALLVAACTSGTKISFNPFGMGQPRVSSVQKCLSQGYRENDSIFGECVAFYDKQTATNRRNIALAIGVAALSVFAFENECDCLFGPDRGTKFSR